jgi:diguanylate cyclase
VSGPTDAADEPPVRKGMLNSRLGWRLFFLFLLAIAIPTVVLTVFVEQQVRRDEAKARQAVLGTSARMLGMQTLDRLVAAQSALHRQVDGPSAAALEPAAGRSRTSADQQPLLRVQALDAPDAAGSLGVVGTAYGLDRPGGTDAGDRDRLRVTRPTPAGGVVIQIAHRDVRGQWWLADVNPAHLWAYAEALPAGIGACARTADDVVLWCSDQRSETLEGAAKPAVRAAVDWELFVPSRFDAASWIFTAELQDAVATRSPLDAGRNHVLALMVALCTAALLAARLLRRLMAPLEQLHRSARRWTQGDLSARSRLAGTDEFAQLGRTFDEMANRLHLQFERDAALSRLDRTVLETADPASALSRFARDLLQALGPAGRVGIAYRVGDGQQRWSCIVAAAGEPAQSFERSLPPRADPAWSRTGPAGQPLALERLQSSLLSGGAAGRSWPVAWKGECLGLVAIDASSLPASAVDALDMAEVCDHLALALGAVRREDQLRDQALTDSLTGLPNRLGLLRRLEQWLDAEALTARPVSLLFIDLDRFKPINDSHGHHAGDAVLVELGHRLAAHVGSLGLVSRPAGDEFVVVTGSSAASGEDLDLAQRLITCLAEPVRVGSQTFALSASIGIARSPAHGTQAQDLLRRADIAMYASKRSGHGRVTVFEDRLEEATQRRFWIERELGGAIDGDGLLLLYQPRVEARHHRCVSVEALVRWVHPTRGVVSPGEFVPVAEEGPLIERLGGWVIEQACRQLVQWRDGPLRHLKVAVNVSVRQLTSGTLPARIDEALRRHALDASQLEIEVTESVMADNLAVISEQLEAIRAMGVEVALDDFGTGYSSMSMLRRLPIDVLKIDRAFVSEIGQDASARAVSASIIALAHQLGKRIVAEGVETEEQARWLTEAGAEELQGYLFSRPITAAELAKHLGGRPPVDVATAVAASVA